MNARERFIAACRLEPVDRPFRFETIGFWPETIDIFCVDSDGDIDPLNHNVLPDVPMKNFEYFLRLVREIAEKAS